jgi:hypothetical protein
MLGAALYPVTGIGENIMGAKQEAAAKTEARRIARHKADVTVGLREQGQHRVATRLLDISRFGFRVELHGLVPESTVWLKLPDAEPQMARVVWSDHVATGCVFCETLPVDLFRQTLRQDCVEATIIAGPWQPARQTA